MYVRRGKNYRERYMEEASEKILGISPYCCRRDRKTFEYSLYKDVYQALTLRFRVVQVALCLSLRSRGVGNCS